MPRIVEHMSVEELGARYRGAQDATEARHTQVNRPGFVGGSNP